MDPASIIGIVGSVVGVGEVVTKVLNRLSNFQTKYRTANTALTVLLGQLYTIRLALDGLRAFTSSHGRSITAFGHLSPVLDGCDLLLSELDRRLDQLELNHAGVLSVTGRATLLWNEADLQHFLSMLNNQVNALNLLLHVFPCNGSRADEMMKEEDNMTILRLSKETTDSLKATASLRAIDDALSGRSPRDSSTIESAVLDLRFDFDAEVLASRPYTGAMLKTTHDLIRARRRVAELEGVVAPDESTVTAQRQERFTGAKDSTGQELMSRFRLMRSAESYIFEDGDRVGTSEQPVLQTQLQTHPNVADPLEQIARELSRANDRIEQLERATTQPVTPIESVGSHSHGVRAPSKNTSMPRHNTLKVMLRSATDGVIGRLKGRQAVQARNLNQQPRPSIQHMVTTRPATAPSNSQESSPVKTHIPSDLSGEVRGGLGKVPDLLYEAPAPAYCSHAMSESSNSQEDAPVELDTPPSTPPELSGRLEIMSDPIQEAPAPAYYDRVYELPCSPVTVELEAGEIRSSRLGRTSDARLKARTLDRKWTQQRRLTPVLELDTTGFANSQSSSDSSPATIFSQTTPASATSSIGSEHYYEQPPQPKLPKLDINVNPWADRGSPLSSAQPKHLVSVHFSDGSIKSRLFSLSVHACGLNDSAFQLLERKAPDKDDLITDQVLFQRLLRSQIGVRQHAGVDALWSHCAPTTSPEVPDAVLAGCQVLSSICLTGYQPTDCLRRHDGTLFNSHHRSTRLKTSSPSANNVIDLLKVEEMPTHVGPIIREHFGQENATYPSALVFVAYTNADLCLVTDTIDEEARSRRATLDAIKFGRLANDPDLSSRPLLLVFQMFKHVTSTLNTEQVIPSVVYNAEWSNRKDDGWFFSNVVSPYLERVTGREAPILIYRSHVQRSKHKEPAGTYYNRARPDTGTLRW